MYRAIRRNRLAAAALTLAYLCFVAALDVFVAWLFGRWWVSLYVVAGVLCQLWYAWAGGQRSIIRDARAANANDGRAGAIVEELAIASGIPTPQLRVASDPAPNACAAGRSSKNAVIVVTSGLLSSLDDNELRAVLAHEFSHIRSEDIRVATLIAGLSSWLYAVANMFANPRDIPTAIFGFIFRYTIGTVLLTIGSLFRLAIGRKRELLADAQAALLTRYPPALESALERIDQEKMPMRHLGRASASTAWFAPPAGKTSVVDRVFRSYPPVGSRIQALETMSERF